jgi:pyruvate, water dikinase
MSVENKKEVRDKNGYIRWFSEINKKDVGVVGGKGANLGEMYNHKFPIPPGFVITAEAYRYFLEESGIKERIYEVLRELDVNDTEALNDASQKIRKLIEGSEFPENLKEIILESYDYLDIDKPKSVKAGNSAMEILKTSHEPPFVAVRSSATAEDLEGASFAGQQESFLNVKGQRDLIKKVKQCFSSLFTARAIYYREKKGFEHEKTALAVVIQKMIDSEKSGVIFSRNPVKKNNSILIEAVWGLGEGIVSGKIKPDDYVISRDVENLNILNENISKKKIAVVRDSSGQTGIVKLREERSEHRVLSNYEIKRLGQYAVQLEEHYGLPQDIEFAIAEEKIYIVQSRPITTEAKDSGKEISGTVLVSGTGASPGAGAGTVKIVKSMEDLSKIKNGDILVTEMTNPDMVVSMQKAAGIVTDEGGLTSHAAIVSREMGIPAIVGTGDATEKLRDGQVVTVDGNSGKVFEGRGEEREVEILPIVETKTKIKVIVDLPDYAERAAKSKARGVGLVRLEGIIATGGKHPLSYVKGKKIEEYVSLLSKGLREICKHFEEVWIRSSDIRTDEYRNLIGANKEVEGNPMLGDHGIRYGLRHPEILRAEFTAIKEIADEFPEKKIGLMAPQIISVSELKEMKRIAKSEVSVPKNVKIGIMVETPAAVQLINDFCEEGLDFISFGTNDLTQYTLAIDRNNSDVQYLYDESNPAVLSSIRYVIRRCKHYGVETSICGQAGSKEEIVKFLIKEGISSISVNADVAHKISNIVSELESGQGEKEEGNDKKTEENEKESDAIVPSEQVISKKVHEEFDDKGNQEEQKSIEKNQEPLLVPNVLNQKRMEDDGADGKSANNLLEEDDTPDRKSANNLLAEDDIENIMLKELGDDEGTDDSYEDETGDGEIGIPKLNEAIPIVSGEMKEEKEEKEIDMTENSDSGKEVKTERDELLEDELLDSEEEDDAEEMGEKEELEDEIFSEDEIEDTLEDEIANEMLKEELNEEWGPSESEKDRKLDIF